MIGGDIRTPVAVRDPAAGLDAEVAFADQLVSDIIDSVPSGTEVVVTADSFEPT